MSRSLLPLCETNFVETAVNTLMFINRGICRADYFKDLVRWMVFMITLQHVL